MGPSGLENISVRIRIHKLPRLSLIFSSVYSEVKSKCEEEEKPRVRIICKGEDLHINDKLTT